MRKAGEATMVQQYYWLLKRMEQESEKLTAEKAKEDNPEISSTNPREEYINKEERPHRV